jgi:hypothetical protein
MGILLIFLVINDTKGARKGIVAKLQSMQGKYLRIITGAYRATAIEALEIEIDTISLDIFIEDTIANQQPL